MNGEVWKLALEAWEKVSKEIGFETRRDAFLQGYYIAITKVSDEDSEEESDNL